MSTPQHSLSPAPPFHITTGVTWYSIEKFSKEWNRSMRTIRRWCVDGTLVSAHCRVYRDFKNRWWIGVPNTDTRPHRPLLQ